MTGPDAPGRAPDDAPTVPGVIPVWPEGPEPGIPGLDYMPSPENGPPPVGVHRRDRPGPPWSWLAAAAALAVLAALVLTWVLAGTTDRPRRPQATAPATDPLASVETINFGKPMGKARMAAVLMAVPPPVSSHSGGICR